jgi:D-methionine transport system permease protein
MSSEMLDLFLSSFGETLLMVGVSSLLGALLGVPMGISCT